MTMPDFDKHDRRSYFGSSDARDIATGNWHTVFAKKMGFEPDVDLSDNFKVQLGVHTEEFHIDWTYKRINEEYNGIYALTKFGEDHKQCFSHINLGGAIIGSHADALLTEPTGDVTILEVKHTGRFRSIDEACDFYMPQIQHHMMAWNATQLCFSAILGTEEPERVWVERSDRWCAAYLQQIETLYQDHILTGEAPAPFMPHTVDVNTVPAMPHAISDSVKRNGFKKRCLDLDNRASVLIPDFISTKEIVKKHDEIKSELKAMMADDEDELYSDLLTIKRNKAGSITFRINGGH